ncbi:MAG: ATP-binding protein [Pseudomonadota bacterium]
MERPIDLSIDADAPTRPSPSSASHSGRLIGEILETSGAACVCTFNEDARNAAIAEGEKGSAMTGQMGSFLKVAVGNRYVFGVVRSLKEAGLGMHAALMAEIDFVGEALREGATIMAFRRGITKYPVPGQCFYTTTPEDLRAIFAPRGLAHIDVGHVYPTDSVPAALLIDPLLGKHFAVLGSTGSGKSSVVALLVRQLVEQAPHGHVLIMDPHNEYAAGFADIGVRFDINALQIPFWLMNLEEHMEMFIGPRTPDREIEVDILKRCLLAARRKGKPSSQHSRITADTPVPYLLSDLIGEIHKAVGKLDKPDTAAPYLKLKAKIEELKADTRYNFMFPGFVVNDDLAGFLAQMFRFPADGKPVSILDLSGVPSEVVNVIVAMLARVVFDFALWSREEKDMRPVLLICEEAHRYVPEHAPQGADAAKRMLDRIAKEGRKYGVSLGLVSQRPADISESVLSQCGTMLAMRMNNERDQRYVAKAMPEGSGALLSALPSLRNQECLVIGEGIAAPSRVAVFDLPPEFRPNSSNPKFSEAWRAPGGTAGFVAKVIERWRSAGKAGPAPEPR